MSIRLKRLLACIILIGIVSIVFAALMRTRPEPSSASLVTRTNCGAGNRVIRDIVGIGWNDDSVDVTYMLSDDNIRRAGEVVYLSPGNFAVGLAHGSFRVDGLERVVHLEDLGPRSMFDRGYDPDAWLWVQLDARWVDGACHQTATIHDWSHDE